jgi:uncharacterized membrane protein YphA (DoxX/SURF4 family)
LFLLKKILWLTISICIGALFIFSGYTKLIAIEPFEWTLAETGLLSFDLANIMARVLIGLEFGLGLLFILNLNFKNYTYSFAAILLLIFNIYLLYILFTYGNSGNCGCFGQTVYMTPLQAYLKNMLMLFLIWLLSTYTFKNIYDKYAKYFMLCGLLIGLLYTCIVAPPEFIYIKEKNNFKPYTINLDAMYSDSATSKPSFDYKHDRKIIAVLSTSCHFCQKAARRMHSLQMRQTNTPFYFVIGSDSSRLKTFLTTTQAYNIPMQLNKNENFLMEIAGGSLPAIFWVQDGQVIKKSNYYNINEAELITWINGKQK